MQLPTWFTQSFRILLALATSLLLAMPLNPTRAEAVVALTQVGADSFTNSTSQHRTAVEPDTFAHGSTIVSAFQLGRFFNGGASGIGFATSTNGGATWTRGALPGITKFLGGTYDRVSDPAVAYDAAHNVWLVSTLALMETPSVTGVAVLVSRSEDGGLTWASPVVVKSGGNLDKNWIVCDSHAASPFRGRCYVQWDDFSRGDLIEMSTSTDGGLTWGTALHPANNGTGLGGQPVVQPNGTVIVPIANAFETAILAFRSTDGGESWSRTTLVAQVVDHRVAGGLRTGPLPSAEVDAAGTVYVVWQDCRFRRGCRSNDIVMSTTTDGLTWSPVTRIPIDRQNSGVDHFIPGLAVDPATSGSTAHLALTYYYYPNARCSTSTCRLSVGYVSSLDGGVSWSQPVQLGESMSLSWLANTSQGYMVGDYISTSFVGGSPWSVVALANAPSGGFFDEAMHAPASGLDLSSGAAVATPGGEHPVPNAAADHAAPQSPVTHR
ncbi:MAG: exo-alpha-sialidase [Chloroflexi bacterium]|nr:exo-alpha-sialidase [Chloroflexota bacterium]